MPRASDSDEQFRCSFCGKGQWQVQTLIAGPGVYICDECVDLCNERLEGDVPHRAAVATGHPPRPHDICAALNQYIIGQEQAKRTLSIAVYKHYQRLRADDDGDIELHKSNVLLLGPAGCGKTLLAQTLARLLDVPFAIVDATALTQAGYVGEDVEHILTKLIRAADNHIERAETGIIYIDESDKVACRATGPSTGRDVSGEGVQQALLAMLEGALVSVPSPDAPTHLRGERCSFDTTNVLFICGGSFHGLDELILHRIGRQRVGFSVPISSQREGQGASVVEHVLPEDLIRYGLIPEFVSRLPVISTVRELSREDLIRVLTEPRNALVTQFQCLFALDGIELESAADALSAVADRALQRHTGARGLRSIIEEALLDQQFELPSCLDVCRCIITKEAIDGKGRPRIDHRERVAAERKAA